MSHRLTPGPNRQGGYRKRSIGRRVRVQAHVVRSAALTITVLAGGCARAPSLDPVAWWHGLEGGKIAEDRPPPPNADQPYPAIGSIPARPAAGDPGQRARIANALLADRTNAQYETTVAPLPAAVSPRPVNVPPPPAAVADLSSASLQAASAPPAPPQAQARGAPVAAPVSAPAPAPAPASATVSAAAVEATMPDIPPGPPPAPRLAGVPGVTVPTPAPVAPPPPAAAPHVARPGEPAAIAFAAGSSHLSSDGVASLKALAKGRGAGLIAVVGYGDAAGTDPAVQAASLPLAFARARAVAAQLQSDGVPPGRLRINAEAAGSGAAARVVS